MILATDVHYFDGRARAAGVLFADWSDALAAATLTADIDAVADYQPGAFYRRELPCLAALLAKLDAPPECIVVDGHAWLDGAGRPAWARSCGSRCSAGSRWSAWPRPVSSTPRPKPKCCAAARGRCT
nr:endonuclease V [Lysobacter enzymogenes]